ncbi:MAG: hypothetical protein VB035_15285 [Candidatus Fimivivens sp.]|nr:hypothetical protein [Candidatus Fimivivens sp.]
MGVGWCTPCRGCWTATTDGLHDGMGSYYGLTSNFPHMFGPATAAICCTER